MISPLQWFDKSSLRSKFFLLGFCCLVVLSLPTALYLIEARKNIEFNQQEIRGLAPAKSLLKVIQRSQQFRGLTSLQIKRAGAQPPKSFPPNLLQRALDVDTAFAEAKIMMAKTRNPTLINELNKIETQWHELKQQGLNQSVDWQTHFNSLVVLIRQELDLQQMIVDQYQLSLDPEADGYFLISASMMQLPELTEVLGQMRALGAIYLTENSLTEPERNKLTTLLALSQNKMEQMNITVEKVLQANAIQGKRIFDKYAATRQQYDATVTLVNDQLLTPTHLDYAPEDYFSAFTLGINSFFSYADYANDEIDLLMRSRITSKAAKTNGLLFYCFIVFFLVALFIFRFIRILIHQLGGEPIYASTVVKRITQGNLTEEIRAQHSDSLLADMQKMQLKLQENERLKNEFISTVSHELRTPLTSISGALSIAVNGKLGELPSQLKEILSVAHKNSQRLTELINDLLDIDKLIAGQLILDKKTVELIPVTQELVKSLHSYADKFGVHLEFVTNVDSVSLEVDPRRLQQVLSNLISNAVKFSPVGETVYINVSTHHARARVEVVDQGSGIPEEFRSRIFQKFSQADSSDRRSKGGTGLGLAISKALVSQMGGEIGFRSSVGIGSCFFLEFPAANIVPGSLLPLPELEPVKPLNQDETQPVDSQATH